MGKAISGAIFGICLFLIIGIVGGIDCGQPLSNLWMCLPLTLIMLISGGIYMLLN